MLEKFPESVRCGCTAQCVREYKETKLSKLIAEAHAIDNEDKHRYSVTVRKFSQFRYKNQVSASVL